MKNMRNPYKPHLFFLFIFLVLACSNNSDDDLDNNNAQGTIQLSGDDTSDVGTTLIVGDVAEGRADLTGTEDSIVIVNAGTVISDDPAPFPPGDPRNTDIFITDDPENGFVIVVGAGGISMSIVVDGIPYRHACISGFDTFIDCGSLDLALGENRVVFNDSTVENTETGVILTLNGTVTW